MGWALNGLQTYRRTVPAPNDDALLYAVEDCLNRVTDLIKTIDRDTTSIANHVATQAGSLLGNIVQGTTLETVVGRCLASASVMATFPADEPRRQQQTPLSAPNDMLGDAKALAIQVTGDAMYAARKNGFDMSTVAAQFDEISKDDALVVRAASGRYFTTFAHAIPNRASEWAERLFMSPNVMANEAAWNGYLAQSNISDITYNVLRPVYAEHLIALSDQQNEDDEDRARHPSSERIFQEQMFGHVWSLLIYDYEELGVTGSLPQLMVDHATPEQLDTFLSDIGQHFRDEQTEDNRNQKIHAAGIAIWEAVEGRVKGDSLPVSVLSGLPYWLKAPLPVEWRFAKAEAYIAENDVMTRNDWALVPALIDLARSNMDRAMELLDKVAQGGSMTALAGIQMNAQPLLREADRGSQKSHDLARSINHILVTNHRPDMLADDEAYATERNIS